MEHYVINNSNKPNYNGSSNNNSLNNNSNNVRKSSSKKHLPVIKYLLLFSIFILLTFAVGIIVYMIKYYTTDCENKYPLLDYLRNLKYNNVCEVSDLVEYPSPLEESCNNTTDEDNRNTQLPCDKEEVFHLNDQIYTYDQAKCKCAVYGAKLASYNQLVDAYNEGANWCSYGWSNHGHGPSAYYLTQKNEYDLLQASPNPDDRDNCGQTGLNGGYFQNKNMRFGINCYGIKPQLDPNKIIIEPPQTGFCDLPENINASNKLNNEGIAPFNTEVWSINNK
jgi:hypothetical protein